MYNFITETQGIETFRVCELAMETPLDTAGLGMLLNNKIAGLCPVSSLQMDNRRFVRYNISSQISLRQFFSDKVDKKRFLRILYNILTAIENMEDYMLDTGMLLLDMEEIYVNVGTLQTDLIYYPLLEERKHFDIYAFVKNLIMSTQFDTNEQDNYVTLLISYLNHTEQMSVSMLKDYVATLQQSETAMTVQAQEPTPLFTAAPMVQNVMDNSFAQSMNAIPESTEYMNSTKKDKGSSILKGLFAKIEVKPKKEKKVKEKPIKEKKKGKEIEAPGGVMIPNMDNVKNSTLPTPPKPAGVPSLSKIKEMERPMMMQPQKPVQPMMQPQQLVQPMMQPQQPVQPVMQLQQPVQPVMQLQKPVQPMMQPQQPAVQPMMQPQQPVIQPMMQPQQSYWANNTDGSTTVLGTERAGATTVLSEGYNTLQRQHNPHLLRKKTNEKVEIDKNIFRIGKERSYVDYCIADNSAVSRSHADIIRKNDEFYIVDNNSLNHTFLNGMQIPSSQMHKLEDFMVIKLADEVFEFIL